MNIYYYDNSAVPYQRLGNRISDNLIDLNHNVRIFYIYDGYNNEQTKLSDKLKKNVTIVDSKKVRANLKKYAADLFVCFGQPSRIPDAYWTMFFNKKNVPTFRVQHGLFIKDYHRTGSFLKDEKYRIIFYLTYLFLIFLNSRFSTKIGTCLELVNRQIKILTTKGKIDGRISSNTVIIWGDYWKSWFMSYPYYTKNNKYIVCGGFDFELLQNKDKLIEPNGKSVTYICQTLVEDGRLEEEMFKILLDRLYEFAINYEGHLYIKLHPRSRKAYYSKLNTLENVSLTDSFPISDVYISHYSTLLTVSVYLNKKILLVQFPGHSIPEAFDHMAKNVINYDSPIHLEDVKELNIPDMNYYYTYIEKPYYKIAKILESQING